MLEDVLSHVMEFQPALFSMVILFLCGDCVIIQIFTRSCWNFSLCLIFDRVYYLTITAITDNSILPHPLSIF